MKNTLHFRHSVSLVDHLVGGLRRGLVHDLVQRKLNLENDCFPEPKLEKTKKNYSNLLPLAP